MKHNHENKMLFWTAVFSTFVSILIIVFGIFYGHKLQKEQEFKEKYEKMYLESPESKEFRMAMRIHTLEQEVDMLRLRIEEMEENNGITNEDTTICGQYWLFQLEATNNVAELQVEATNNVVEPQVETTNVLAKLSEAKIDLSLAIDDLVPTNSL